jgi:hypothetical protein
MGKESMICLRSSREDGGSNLMENKYILCTLSLTKMPKTGPCTSVCDD